MKKIIIMLFMILIFILFSIIREIYNKRQDDGCITYLKKLNISLNMYIYDYDMQWPTSETWKKQILYKNDVRCPSRVNNPQGYGYAYNQNLSGISNSRIEFPHFAISICDAANSVETLSNSNPFVRMPVTTNLEKGWERHHGGANYLLCDGHVIWARIDQLEPFIEPPNSRLSENPTSYTFRTGNLK